MIREILFDINNLNKTLLESKGVYKITNKINGNFYIGSTIRSFKDRFKEHCGKFMLFLNRGGRLDNPILWKAYEKYGIENFQVDILKVMNNATLNEILEQEEKYINELKPLYNICQNPTKGGIPNKNKKLTDSWKEHIREKSKLYKHSPETLEKVTKNNKENACKIEISNNHEKILFNSWIEFANFFHLTGISAGNSSVKKALETGCEYKGWKIKKLSQQRKQIKLYYEDNIIVLKSFAECDRFLNMWRGYTSTQYNRNNFILKEKYKYEII